MNYKEERYKRNILLLLKFDSENLHDRIKYNFLEYMKIFSMKRTRDHFIEIFKSRYNEVPFHDLKICSEDIILYLNSFYNSVDKLHWYLLSTEDMPAMVEDKVKEAIRELEAPYETLQLYLDEELNELAQKNESELSESSMQLVDEVEEESVNEPETFIAEEENILEEVEEEVFQEEGVEEDLPEVSVGPLESVGEKPSLPKLPSEDRFSKLDIKIPDFDFSFDDKKSS